MLDLKLETAGDAGINFSVEALDGRRNYFTISRDSLLGRQPTQADRQLSTQELFAKAAATWLRDLFRQPEPYRGPLAVTIKPYR